MGVDIPTLIESVAAGNEDMRNLLYAFYNQDTLLNKATGNSQVDPASGAQQSQAATPVAGTIAVSGANGTYQVSIANAAQSGVNTAIYNEVSYSPIKSFGQSVTVLPASTATTVTVPNPGQSLFFRFRSSFDRQNWNSYTLAATTPISSNLQSSAASENNVSLNQSNYAYVDSVSVGATADVRVYGAAGPYNGYTKNLGGVESPRPSATIVNAAHNSTQIVAYDGEQFQIASTLPGVFSDTFEPVGQVSVVGSGSPTLPVVTPILSAQHLIGATFTPGSGLTQPPTLTVSDTGGGTGAVILAIIAGGVMTGYDIQAAGENYTGATIITATGGVFSGATGGGTASGGNGGRLTKI